jgi:hypothetical protein
MDYYLIDFNNELNYSFDNVIIGKKINCSSTENIFKYFIYYSNNISPKSIYLKVPRVRLMYKLGQNNYNQERIVLYPLYDQLQIFINFIKEFEENITICIKNKYSNLELNSILIKNSINNNYSLKVNVDDNIKITSTFNKTINLKDFKINNEVELVIKLNYIWIKENKFGLNCSLYQIKYYASLQELNIDLLDKQIYDSKIESSKNNSIENLGFCPIVVEPVLIPPKQIGLVPSIDALINAKKKLKPTN